jgi:hypothetical protein
MNMIKYMLVGGEDVARGRRPGERQGAGRVEVEEIWRGEPCDGIRVRQL